MLIEFTVGNYLSIKDKQTLRMDASSITEYQDRLIDAGRYKLLRSAVIYGANASGKSNVLKAMAAMSTIIITSARRSSTNEIDVEPFLLSTETEHAPTFFEIIFLIDDVRYRYGFEADRKSIHTEWLFETKKQQEKMLFIREEDTIQIAKSFVEGKELEDRTRKNALFLAICDQFNGKTSRLIMGFFNFWLTISGISHQEEREISLSYLSDENFKQLINPFLNKLNLGFFSIIVNKRNESLDFDLLRVNLANYQKFISTLDADAIHKKYNGQFIEVEDIRFNIESKESAGTNKLIDLLAPLFRSLVLGRILIIDELDAKLHPLMTREIVNLFNDPVSNKKGAQLIFTTHDTNLLTYGQFRRDQIYFTEKDQYGATSLYSLVEYKEEDGGTVRKDRSFEKDYIQGRYGAIPFIGDFSKLTSTWQEK